MSNDARITKTLHQASLRLVAALADDPDDPRVQVAAHTIAELAEIVDRSHAIAVTVLRRSYDAPHLQRQLEDAHDAGPDLTDVLIRLRQNNVVDLATERARRRGPATDVGA